MANGIKDLKYQSLSRHLPGEEPSSHAVKDNACGKLFKIYSIRPVAPLNVRQ